MADDKIEDAPAPEPFVRWRRSAETLFTTRCEVPAALAQFAGLPKPSGTLAVKLITHTLDTLEALVPIGEVRTANDLVDAARDLGHETVLLEELGCDVEPIHDLLAELICDHPREEARDGDILAARFGIDGQRVGNLVRPPLLQCWRREADERRIVQQQFDAHSRVHPL